MRVDTEGKYIYEMRRGMRRLALRSSQTSRSAEGVDTRLLHLWRAYKHAVRLLARTILCSRAAFRSLRGPLQPPLFRGATPVDAVRLLEFQQLRRTHHMAFFWTVLDCRDAVASPKVPGFPFLLATQIDIIVGSELNSLSWMLLAGGNACRIGILPLAKGSSSSKAGSEYRRTLCVLPSTRTVPTQTRTTRMSSCMDSDVTMDEAVYWALAASSRIMCAAFSPTA